MFKKPLTQNQWLLLAFAIIILGTLARFIYDRLALVLNLPH